MAKPARATPPQRVPILFRGQELGLLEVPAQVDWNDERLPFAAKLAAAIVAAKGVEDTAEPIRALGSMFRGLEREAVLTWLASDVDRGPRLPQAMAPRALTDAVAFDMAGMEHEERHPLTIVLRSGPQIVLAYPEDLTPEESELDVALLEAVRQSTAKATEDSPPMPKEVFGLLRDDVAASLSELKKIHSAARDLAARIDRLQRATTGIIGAPESHGSLSQARLAANTVADWLVMSAPSGLRATMLAPYRQSGGRMRASLRGIRAMALCLRGFSQPEIAEELGAESKAIRDHLKALKAVAEFFGLDSGGSTQKNHAWKLPESLRLS